MTAIAKLTTDKKRGAIFEEYVQDYFERRGWTIKRAKGYVPGWDLILTRDKVSIYVEVKHDLMSDRTWNYALEFASLEHTQSSVLIIGTIEESYAIPMETARALFNEYPKVQSGDQAYNYSALIPKIVFQQGGYQRL